MAAVKWKEPSFISVPVISLAILMLLLPSLSDSQWISYKRSGRHSNLWHPNMPAPRTLRHSHSSSSSSSSSSNSRSSNYSPSNSNGNRPIEHRSVSHSNFYTINNSAREQQQSNNGAYHQQQRQHHQQQSSQARYSSADFGRGSKTVRISDIPARSSPSSPTAASYQHQRSMGQTHHNNHQQREQVPSNSMSHRHLPMSHHHQSGQSAKQSKSNWSQQQQHQQSSSKNQNNARSGMYDSTRRPVSQQAGHLLDSWPNSNTHHHLAPVPTSAGSSFNKQVSKPSFSNLKPEWGNNVLVSNKAIELKAKPMKPKPTKQQGVSGDDKKASDRQLILPSGYPVKDKTAVANTINTLTKLSPKKPIFVFMRKEGLMAVKAGADAGDVIKKLAGTSKLPFYNGTHALPTHNMPTVFLAPEDMNPPTGYGKIPIPNLKPKTHSTPKPTYTKILMPGGTHMKGSLVTPTTTTTPAPTSASSTVVPPLNLDSYGAMSSLLFQNQSVNTMTIEQKLQLLQLLRSQPNHPLADQAALAILASATPPSASPFSPTASPSAPVPSAVAPQSLPGLSPIVQGPVLAMPTPGHPNSVWPPQLFPGQQPPPNGLGFPPTQLNLIVSSTTPSSLNGQPSSISPLPSMGPTAAGTGGAGNDQNDIHKLIGTIVESAVSNTVTSMLQHQRILQGQGQPGQIVGVGPPLHAANLQGRPPPPHGIHFGRGPPPPRPPQGPPPPRPFPPFQQRPPFPPSPLPGRFPPHQNALPPQQHPSLGAPPPGFPQPQPSAVAPQQLPPNPTAIPQQISPSPSAAPSIPTQAPSAASPIPSFQFQQQQQQQQFQFQQQSQPQPQQYPPQQVPGGPVQHPLVPQFALPPGYAQPSSTPQPLPSSPGIFNPSSTPAPPHFHQQQHQQFQQQPSQQFYHPNGIRPPPNGKPGHRMVERPFGNKPRNPLHNALQFFGISTPRPDHANKSPTPSGTPAIVSSTPYPRPPYPPTPTPFGRPHPFPSSTPAPQHRFPMLPFPHQPPQPIQLPHQLVPQQPQVQQQQQQQQQQLLQTQASNQQQQQIQIGLQQGDGKGKKPTLIVQTPSGSAGKKNTYVITGGGSELPELNKIMKVLNDLHVDSENNPQQQSPSSPSPSSPSPTTPQPIYSSSPSSPVPISASRGPIQFNNHRPTISPNVMIKNANVGITPSPTPGVTGASVSSTQQLFSTTSTPAPLNPSSIRPHIMSSTTIPPSSNVSPVMQIIKSIQQHIPGVHVSPSVQTIELKNQQHSQSARPINFSTARPLVSPSPSSPSILISSPRPPIVSPAPSSIGPILLSSPTPRPIAHSPTPTPGPGQVIISSTGFPRVINVSPSGSDTPQSIHQAVVEAIMKQQAAEAGGAAPGGQIVINGVTAGGLPSAGPTPQFIEVIPAGGSIPGLGGNSNSKPFVVQLNNQQQQRHQNVRPTLLAPTQQSHHSGSVEESNDHAHAQQHLPFDLNNPNIHIQRGSLESHETYTEKSRAQSVSVSSSVESSEKPRPVYSRERYPQQGGKVHHHSKEVADDDYKNERRRPIYSHRTSKEQYDEEEAAAELLNPNRRMYSGETSKQQDVVSEEKKKSEPQKLIEKIVTEEKIIWRQGPGEGELIPAKVRTEERIILKPNSNEASLAGATRDGEFSQRRTPLASSLENFAQNKQQVFDKSSSAASMSKELGSPSNFAGILRSKMKFDKMMEKLYPTKQLVSPFTITNNSAKFHNQQNYRYSGEVVPTIASSLITTPSQQQFIMSSVSPTMQSMFGSTLNGLVSPSPTSADQGRFKIRPGDVEAGFPGPTKQNIMLGVSPSGQPILIQSSPSSPLNKVGNSIAPSEQFSVPSSPSSPSSTVEQRLVFIPQGTAASHQIKANNNKPQILITTVDELPDLMAQLSGTNPEIRMVPDKATLEAELAKVAASSTVSATTTTAAKMNLTTTAETNPPPPPSPSAAPTKAASTAPETIQSTLFNRAPPTPPSANRRMDGPEKAFTWRPAVNTTAASPLSTTLSLDTSRRLVAGLGAGMLHAMSAGFGNIGNGVLNKFAWLGPSAIPPQLSQQSQVQPQTTQQLLYSMQQQQQQQQQQYPQQAKLPIVGPYQQVLIQPGQVGKEIPQGAPLGYYSYKWGGLLPEQQPPTAIPTVSTTEASTKSPDYKLLYRSQYREEELPIPPEKLQPVSPVHKLKKGSKVKARTRTTSSPIDPVSAEEYENDDDNEDDDDLDQEELIPNDTVLKHAGRGKVRQQAEDSSEDGDSSEEEPRRRQDTGRRGKPRRRRPVKLSEDEEDLEEEKVAKKNFRSKMKLARPTKPTYDEEDDASPAPKGIKTKSHGQSSNKGRSDIDRSFEEDEEEDYEVYDVKPAFNVKRKRPSNANPTAQPPSSTTAAASKSNKNKAIYVNREMFLVSGEDKGLKEGSPKAEPVYQPNQPITKFPVLLAPSIITGQSVVKKANSEAGDLQAAPPKPTTTLEPKTTAASPTTSTSTTTLSTSTTSKATTTKLAPTKPTPTKATTKKASSGKKADDYSDTQDELRSLLRKIQDRLSAQDEIYDFGDDAALYDYYDEMQQVLSTKATTTTTTTKATSKPKKTKGKKNKKNKKKNKKNKKNKKKNKSKVKAVTKPIPTRKPVTSTLVPETVTTPTVYVHHHQRHPVSSLEQFSSFGEKVQKPVTSTTTQATTTTTSPTTTTTTTTTPPPPVQSQSVEEAGASGEGVNKNGASSQSGSVETQNVAYVFSENAKEGRPKLRRRPLWVRRRIGSAAAMSSGEGLHPVRMPNGPNGKVIRLVRRRRPIGGGGRRRLMQQRQQQSVEQQSVPLSSTEPPTSTTAPSSTQASIEVAPPNFSSPPLEQYFEQNSLERRVGSSADSTESSNGTVVLRSPKRKLKLIRLKGQRAQWRLRLQGTGDEESRESGGGLRPAALIAPREVSAPLPLQAPLPAPVFTSGVSNRNIPPKQNSFGAVYSPRTAKSTPKLYSTSYSSESASSSVETKVCVRGKCEIVSRQ